MAISMTGTTTDTRTPRSTKSARDQTVLRSPPKSPKQPHESPSQSDLDHFTDVSAVYSYLNFRNGLGITNLPPVKQGQPSLSDSGAPVAEIAEIGIGSRSINTAPAGNVQKLPWREARDRIRELQKSLDAVGSYAQSPEDGNSSATSSTGRDRTSADSSVTVSTIPTTPAASLGRSSRKGSPPSSPSRSRSPSPRLRLSSTDNVEDAIKGSSARIIPGTKLHKNPLSKRKGFDKRSNDHAQESERPRSSKEQAKGDSHHTSPMLRTRSAISVAGLFRGSISENELPASSKHLRVEVPPLPTSFSTDRIPSLVSPLASPGRAVSTPRLVPTERMNGSATATPKKKDELWTVFRTLDGDFAKFASKSLAMKANVVRSSLLPFLRTYATHPSNRNLRLEDLDRRTTILNKWWTGLLDLLQGQQNQSISGSDRPAILDGISGIMDRPEWRPSLSPFCALSERSQGAPSPQNYSRTSFMSNASDFLSESVLHNVRNIFVQNLTAQMAFVVDKMSLLHASASLVTFCGKACAYAFVFVPCMADVLVRLWDLRIEPVQRILKGQEISKFHDMSAVTETLTSVFPPALQQLGFTSLMKYMRKLRTPPQVPVGTSNIEWWGPWLERWSGRDSDLFYVFVKHFYILVTDFLPADVTKKERLCAPCVLLVHAQLLTNLDATIHRQAILNQQDLTAGGPSQTFDEMLPDPDAVASTLPIPPTNATRLTAENRLVMLIRDVLSERATDHIAARLLFAEGFSDLLQTTALSCSLFDHAACYTLLDFLEETMVLLARFEHLHGNKGTIIDLDFWMIVWKKMISSHNTLTEVRLYAFLYTVWNTVICEPGHKVKVCSKFLLDPEIFESRFAHWSPTVRSYYMRLLCWRVARQDGEYSSADVEVLETVVERLQTCWSHYIFLHERSVLQGTPPLPTNPCNPIPGRRLRILRTETPGVNLDRGYLSVEGILPSEYGTISPPSAFKRTSALSDVELDVRSDSPSNSDPEPEPRGRGFGGFIRNLIAPKSRSNSRPSTRCESQLESPAAPEPLNDLERAATGDFPSQSSSAPSSRANSVERVHQRKLCFKFALEHLPNAKPLPPMRLSPPRLPAPAQQFLAIYSRKSNGPSYIRIAEPRGASKAHAKYCGHALAEWAVVLGECQSFFERRKNEGVLSNKFVETPTLGVEVFRR